METPPPEIRQGVGEIEAALSHSLPRLLELSDIRSDLHLHTNSTDSRSSLEENRAKAAELGYGYIAVTDHAYNLRMVKGLDVEQLEEQWANVDALNSLPGPHDPEGHRAQHRRGWHRSTTPMKSLHGSTSASRLCIPAGEKPKTSVTSRLLKAMDSPYVDIIGHPTGRIIGRREPIALDMEAVLAKAGETGHADGDQRVSRPPRPHRRSPAHGRAGTASASRWAPTRITRSRWRTCATASATPSRLGHRRRDAERAAGRGRPQLAETEPYAVGATAGGAMPVRTSSPSLCATIGDMHEPLEPPSLDPLRPVAASFFDRDPRDVRAGPHRHAALESGRRVSDGGPDRRDGGLSGQRRSRIPRRHQEITKRNEVMYGPPGSVYVYFTYGNHHMINLVCCAPGTAGAVLIRALEPLVGIEDMSARRHGRPLHELTQRPRQAGRGPGQSTFPTTAASSAGADSSCTIGSSRCPAISRCRDAWGSLPVTTSSTGTS